MTHSRSEQYVQQIAGLAGITFNGPSSTDIRVLDTRFYSHVLRYGSLGMGEAYVKNWWETEELDACLTKILTAHLDNKIRPWWPLLKGFIGSRLFNRQSKKMAWNIGPAHYDRGNDLYKAMLDRRMAYSCGYWKNATTLDEAQEAKLDLVCRKLSLQPGMKVLDIGCGWGSFAAFAAERYGVEVVGITVSKEQLALAQEKCRGLSVELRLEDYRSTKGTFDRIASIGMFEHVGLKNYHAYFGVVRRCLKPNGLFLLHTIGSNISQTAIEPWINRYIFPNAVLPSVAQIASASEGLFILEDWHNFGPDYDRTLLAWYQNFNVAWNTLEPRYGQQFYRLWKYYLLSSAAAFRARATELWQIVFSPLGTSQKYQSVR